jgi:elongation factor G
VPQKDLYHYSTVVRSLTSGRGRHSEEFSHYDEVPPDLTQKILSERGKRNGSAPE